MKIKKEEAIEAWEKLDEIIDSLDWDGIFSNNELNTVEKSMTLIHMFILERR